jgi:hypothetical protein
VGHRTRRSLTSRVPRSPVDRPSRPGKKSPHDDGIFDRRRVRDRDGRPGLTAEV